MYLPLVVCDPFAMKSATLSFTLCFLTFSRKAVYFVLSVMYQVY